MSGWPDGDAFIILWRTCRSRSQLLELVGRAEGHTCRVSLPLDCHQNCHFRFRMQQRVPWQASGHGHKSSNLILPAYIHVHQNTSHLLKLVVQPFNHTFSYLALSI